MANLTAAPASCPLASNGRTQRIRARILARHWAELKDSAIAADVARANVASWGLGTERHWENERKELLRFARRQIQTESLTGKGHQQNQPGHLTGRLIGLDRRYRHLQAGGWRSLSDTVPGVERFDQWKPDQSRQRRDKPGRSIKYEAPPQCPDGGGLLLPHVPERCWRLICERQGLPFPADRTDGFWAWALVTPELQLVICEGWKKALAALSAGWAAVALPGVQMGRRRVGDDERLIEALQRLAPERRWRIAFDAEAKRSTAAKVAAAAGCLARALRAAGGEPEIAWLPLLPGTDKTGLDDLLVSAGPEALDRALADTGPRPVLPYLRAADRVAAGGRWLGEVQPLPKPTEAPLVLLQAPMGCGKTQAIAAAVEPLLAEGTPLLVTSHRQALGQALAERLGVAWIPRPGSDERLQGAGFCLDSCCPNSHMQIHGDAWNGGVLVLDEWMQAVEHLLLSHGTALGDRRAPVLRTLAELLSRQAQVIAADAQLSNWGVELLERITGSRGLLIRSDHQPMQGRELHCPSGFKTAPAAAAAFRVRWAELVAKGEPFFCWTTAQQKGMANAGQTLAAHHQQLRPNARLLVIDSTQPEAAAELAADPDGVAEKYDAIYCSPAISSGISFERWKPAAVIALAGGQIAPEHVVQAVARVRNKAVPVYLFAPERCPGAALRVGSGDTKPAQLIQSLKATTDPLYGALESAGADGLWLQAWASLGAVRNRQRFAYRATIAGLLEAEGWTLQATTADESPEVKATAKYIKACLKLITRNAKAEADQAICQAEVITAQAAAELAKKRRLTPNEQATLDRYKLVKRWGLAADAVPSLKLLEADRDGLRERLKTGWMLMTSDAAALVPEHDQAAITALDPEVKRPFEPDRQRVVHGSKLASLKALRLPELLRRFGAGEQILATDPAVVALHANATAHRKQLVAAVGVSPGKLATGTLRNLLKACGWGLIQVGRRGVRDGDRDELIYAAARMDLPNGVTWEALEAVWMAKLQPRRVGALFVPIEKPYREKKCATSLAAPFIASAPPPKKKRIGFGEGQRPPAPRLREAR